MHTRQVQTAILAEEGWWKKSWKDDEQNVGYVLDMVSIKTVVQTTLDCILQYWKEK
jgi:hypothetical protein